MHKESELIWEAYISSQRGYGNADYYADALANPRHYELYLVNVSDEDWEGSSIERLEATLYKVGNPRDYDRITNPDDIEQIRDVFDRVNPDGIIDNR